MDITPHTNLLRSLRGERTNYNALVGEGVDNALDAGATRVTVTISDDSVVFEDNGVGITRSRIESVFSIGDHGAMTTTQLGRFGVGIKSQAVNAGNTMQVTSFSRDGKVSASVNWAHVLKSGAWRIDPPAWLPVSAPVTTGTRIVVSDLLREPKINIDRLRQDVAIRFHPAIAGGKTITLNGDDVEALPEPRLTDVIECNLGLADGRSAFLRAGILAEPSRLNRVHVAYNHRVIMPSSNLGCGDYGGIQKMFARLQLAGPWRLAKFKDDLPNDDEREELAEAVLLALTPILEKCRAASMSAKVLHFSDLLNDSIPPELSGGRRPDRKKDEKCKPAAKRNRPGLVEVEKSSEGGPAKAKRTPHDRLVITFDGFAEEDGIGSYQAAGKAHRVNLSRDHPLIAQMLDHRDEALSFQTLRLIAFAIFEEGRQARTPDLFDASFGQRVAQNLAIQDTPGERAA